MILPRGILWLHLENVLLDKQRQLAKVIICFKLGMHWSLGWYAFGDLVVCVCLTVSMYVFVRVLSIVCHGYWESPWPCQCVGYVVKINECLVAKIYWWVLQKWMNAQMLHFFLPWLQWSYPLMHDTAILFEEPAKKSICSSPPVNCLRKAVVILIWCSKITLKDQMLWSFHICDSIC